MKFGIQWTLRNPALLRRPSVDLYSDTLDEIVAAEQLGFESAWVTEHHFADDDYLPSVMPVLGAIAARTTRIRLGPYTLQIPLHHPIRLAEDAAVVDILSKGRLDLALGVGYKFDEFKHLGVPRSSRGVRTDEGVAILQQAWQDTPVTFAGSVFQVDQVTVTPKPVQRPIPIYLGGAGRPVLERIARLGVTGLAGIPARDDMDFFLAELAKHNRNPEEVRYLPFRYLWVDSNHERARRTVRPHIEWVLHWYNVWARGGARPIPYEDVDPFSVCIAGCPDYCVEQLSCFVESVSPAVPDRVIIQPPLLGINHEESMRMIETFATDVAPHFAGLRSPGPVS